MSETYFQALPDSTGDKFRTVQKTIASQSSMKLALFVAVHKDANGIILCIQRSDIEGAGGIPTNWWQRSEP